MNITINKLELASELADDRLRNELSASEIYVISKDSTTYYTDKAQDLFNEYYDHYLTIIDDCEISNN
jgi:hypothetical protein